MKNIIKKFLALIICVFAVFSLSACQKTETSDEHASVPSAILNEADDLISQMKYDEAYKLLYEYRDAEEVKSILDNFTVKYTRLKNTYTNGGETEEILYEYNENGLLVREDYVSVSSSGRYVSAVEYAYDENGLLVAEYQTSEGKESCVVNYTYENGKAVKLTWNYTAGTTVTYENTYDKDGRLKKQVRNFPENEKNTYEYLYDEQGNITREFVLIEDGEEDGMPSSITYEYTNDYGENGNLVKVSKATENIHIGDWNYSYDSVGNLVKTEITNAGDLNATEEYSGYVYFYNAD